MGMKTDKHTAPRIVKGKKPTNIPKGSTLEKELAKNIWYVNYSFNGKQYRVKEGLNRIHDHKEKSLPSRSVTAKYKSRFSQWVRTEKPEMFLEQVAKQTITLADAVKRYLSDLGQHARPKTVQTYDSKLRYLVEAYPYKQLKDITTKDIEKYIRGKIHATERAKMVISGKTIELDKIIQWSPNTVKAARRIFTSFFNWCTSEQYIIQESCI